MGSGQSEGHVPGREDWLLLQIKARLLTQKEAARVLGLDLAPFEQSIAELDRLQAMIHKSLTAVADQVTAVDGRL
jgi:hypothetical protein